MEITPVQLVAVLLSGLAAGFINVLAGGGSFLTLAALDFAGLDIAVANATNRVAVEVGAVTSTLGFRSKGVCDFRFAAVLALPGLLGSLVGALIASRLPGDVFKRLVGVAMVFMLVTLIFHGERWIKKADTALSRKRRVWTLVFFFIGIYGGAIQAGVGFLLTAALVLLAGQDLVRTAFFKVFTVGVYTLGALAMFALQGQVNWLMGAVLSVGNGLGAWLTSRLAVAKGEGLIRWVLIIMLAVLSVRYLGLIPGFS